MTPVKLPADPLINIGRDYSIHQRTIRGILASYHSNFDVLAELIQNSVDAIEDSQAQELSLPHKIEVVIDLRDNFISVLDSGTGMSDLECVSAFAPHISYKVDNKPNRINAYRGFKGVGLTFISYGTNNVAIHSKQEDKTLFKGKMIGARDWVDQKSTNTPEIVIDNESSPLDKSNRGTFVKVTLSSVTKPKQLSKIVSEAKAWELILRTKTAIGQIDPVNELATFTASLTVVNQNGAIETLDVEPKFLYPHNVKRPKGQSQYRFKDLKEHYEKYPDQPPRTEDKRQDGIYFSWTTDEIIKNLSKDEKTTYETLLKKYNASLYCFLPYTRSLYKEIDEISTGRRDRQYTKPSMIISVNRQRLSDYFDFKPTRFESLAENMYVIVNYTGAEPDQGRKTLQDEDMEAAQRASNRALQYIARQRDFLRPPNDNPTADQIENERSHDDWKHNVIEHSKNNKLEISNLPSKSIPLTEQDVVSLFSQVCAMKYIPGIEIFSTSSSHTYDSLVRYSILKNDPSLLYNQEGKNALGVSQFIIGDSKKNQIFVTKYLTLEYKSVLDLLIEEFSLNGNVKDFRSIDILVCWNRVAESNIGYELTEITHDMIDERRYPGITHILTRLEDESKIGVIMLENVLQLIK